MEFDFASIPSRISRIKIDVGLSYNAPHSRRWLNQNNDLYVFGFDPNPDCLNSLRTHYYTPRLQLCQFALGNVDTLTYMDFYMMGKDCGTSSLFKPKESAFDNLGPVKEVIKTPVISLKFFFDKFPWDRFPLIEYIKIDAQGADLDVLKGAGNYLAERVVYVTAEPEFEVYQDCSHNNASNIIEYMTSIGFVQVKHSNTRDPTFLNPKFSHLADSIFIYQEY
jgi:FkbM family methyltransferase